MDILDIVLTILSSLVGGLVVFLGWMLILGRKFQIIDDLKKCSDGILADIKDLIGRVSKIEGMLAAKSGAIGPGSPLSPTELGVKYIKESGLEDILDNNSVDFKKGVKALLPKNYTEYDVQEYSRKFLMDKKDDVLMNPIKNYAFNNGIDVETIIIAGALWLRDDVLGIERRTSKSETKN